MLHLFLSCKLKLFYKIGLPVSQGAHEEDFSEPIADENSVHSEFISDSFAHQPEQGNVTVG